MTFWQRLRGLFADDMRPEHATACADCGRDLGSTALPYNGRLYCSEDCQVQAISHSAW